MDDGCCINQFKLMGKLTVSNFARQFMLIHKEQGCELKKPEVSYNGWGRGII